VSEFGQYRKCTRCDRWTTFPPCADCWKKLSVKIAKEIEREREAAQPPLPEPVGRETTK